MENKERRTKKWGAREDVRITLSGWDSEVDPLAVAHQFHLPDCAESQKPNDQCEASRHADCLLRPILRLSEVSESCDSSVVPKANNPHKLEV